MSDAAAPLEVLTPPEVARMLRVDPQTVLSWIRAGELPAFAVNPSARKVRFRIRRERLEEFLERREAATRPDPPRRRRPRRPSQVIQFFK